MELLVQAVTIMSVGMALVFAFLALMIGGIVLAARCIRAYEARQAVSAGTLSDLDRERLAAVIAVAITEQDVTP
ncbi:MAG: hypothetical protein GX595_16420 [Lentisphaerae bacterium]|nr:hypothetical protein [Lentisphaerota bacterium]